MYRGDRQADSQRREEKEKERERERKERERGCVYIITIGTHGKVFKSKQLYKST